MKTKTQIKSNEQFELQALRHSGEFEIFFTTQDIELALDTLEYNRKSTRENGKPVPRTNYRLVKTYKVTEILESGEA
jgi:hypothetical protein